MQGSKHLEMTFGALAVSASSHPNEMKFRGVLVRLDENSTKPPNGSEGHKIYVPTSVAKRRLSTLIGMGLNYSPDLKGHAQRRKVGVIQKAWIDGRDLCVSGVIWKHDFPEAEKDLKRSGLGMSMELGKVQVENLKADVWRLDDFYFLGATILMKDAAAYHKTLAIAAKADERSKGMKVTTTKKKVAAAKEMTPEAIAAIAAAAATKAVEKSVLPQFARINRSMAALAERVEEIDIAAGADDDEIDLEGTVDRVDEERAESEEEEKKVKASKKKTEESDGDKEDEDDDEDDDEEDMDSEADHGIDEGDLERMGPETGDDAEDDDDPGEINKGTKNKGSKTTSEDKLGKNVNEPVTGSALAVLRRHVKAMAREMKVLKAAAKENITLRKRLSRYEKQVKAASDAMDRHGVPPELTGLLAKSSLDLNDLRASGQKLSVADIDNILQNAGVELPTVKRIELKNAFMNAGLMEEGAVSRGAGR